MTSRPSPDITDPTTQTVTSAVFGVFQGLEVASCALPPALLSDCSQVVAFLVSFCATSILVVGIMAAAFGGATARLSRVSDCALYRLALYSSCACIGIALAWVALVATSKVNAVVG
ncbi:hypothetical protein PHYSODRAFT_252716 [Phytophthora sojae]|uniref:Uncharacterized protein n=1 Tax=Phytophthora sojae (strain P6497) TaxID=1094619 RepID=G5A7I2_PHYSP|nr:hypothetical protein PHYSODRAFT_252716 [Phytophthora sojae]EGZ07861.1 hypothetical protein PHYSODRAFT_252716 [Phytophthora sojae]|eukprot:XP_009536033.1 hypothetical protein PHYSODRAFT_252716 [Phytophthora sojae]